MVSPSIVLALAVLSGAPDSLPLQERRAAGRVTVDQPAPSKPPRNPFAFRFRKPTDAVALEFAHPGLPKGPDIQCGLKVWHVDASLDPKMVVRAGPEDIDPKIAVRPPAPCTKK